MAVWRPVGRPGLRLGLWLAVLGLCAAPGQGLVGFQHGDVRCKCSCPEVVVPNVTVTNSSNGCSALHTNYNAGQDDPLQGQETCFDCFDAAAHTSTVACSYAVVARDSSQCFCENIMPLGSGGVRTQRSVGDCGLCSCTFEARNQALIKGLVIFVIVLLLGLCLVTVFNAIPEQYLGWMPKQLSLRADPDIPLVTESGAVIDPRAERRRVGGRRKRLISLDVLKRRPFDSQIGW